MKRGYIFYLALIVIFLQFSCKDRNQVRIRNSFANPITVVVGPADFGSVKSVSTTEYKSVPKGSQTISGDIDGKIVIPKHGKHKYTININTGGIVTLIEDSK